MSAPDRVPVGGVRASGPARQSHRVAKVTGYRVTPVLPGRDLAREAPDLPGEWASSGALWPVLEDLADPLCRPTGLGQIRPGDADAAPPGQLADAFFASLLSQDHIGDVPAFRDELHVLDSSVELEEELVPGPGEVEAGDQSELGRATWR